jgi:hypothetical protein
MTRVIVDQELRNKLGDLTEPIELCDETGRVLARVNPALDPELYDLEPKISDEEIERRLSSKEKWYTTAEVLAYLESL